MTMLEGTLNAGALHREDLPSYFVAQGSKGSNTHPFAGLPFAPFWVFLSGKEILGRKRAWEPRNSHYLIAAIIWLVAGVAGIVWSLQSGSLAAGAPVYIASMILIVGGARYFVATNIHMMAHNLMFSKESANHWWGEIFSTIFLIQSITRYQSDHLAHHGKIFATLKDGDAVMVLRLGFAPGKTRRELWMNLIRLCLSPSFHAKFLVGRLKENLVLCPRNRALMTVGWFAILGLIGYEFGFAILFHVYILPIFLLIQIPALVQLLCEHIYISADMSPIERHKLLSNGRYCGVPLPQRSGSNVQYAADLLVWSLRILLVELPARIIIFQGSLPEHDWHHRHFASRQWANGRMLREEELREQIVSRGETDFLEVWGSIEVVDRVLRSISKASPYPELKELVLSGALDYGDIK
jgi:fatty acid desaturase